MPDPVDSLPAGLDSAPRLDHEPPPVIARLGWRYHHVGIPTDRVREGETFLEAYGLHVCGFRQSPYGIEWMRWEKDLSLIHISEPTRPY